MTNGLWVMWRVTRLLRRCSRLGDAVVLCNIPHEIADTDWLAAFRRIYDVLTDDGTPSLAPHP